MCPSPPSEGASWSSAKEEQSRELGGHLRRAPLSERPGLAGEAGCGRPRPSTPHAQASSCSREGGRPILQMRALRLGSAAQGLQQAAEAAQVQPGAPSSPPSSLNTVSRRSSALRLVASSCPQPVAATLVIQVSLEAAPPAPSSWLLPELLSCASAGPPGQRPPASRPRWEGLRPIPEPLSLWSALHSVSLLGYCR